MQKPPGNPPGVLILQANNPAYFFLREAFLAAFFLVAFFAAFLATFFAAFFFFLAIVSS